MRGTSGVTVAFEKGSEGRGKGGGGGRAYEEDLVRGGSLKVKKGWEGRHAERKCGVGGWGEL